ncbi:HEAT repeat domain-containing protein [Calothrix sp. UHCC 0171]|uniref:HEAT repeat domain-containing protein n=1 Tax=Calothrix sp. UHCC 0171 TaxID=3110245 RepID=UPI002B1ED8B9|nr:HEAT repeat domain-containing protein [Calothrix sp. UHCC 0171]MEA5574089.1 HEAT repeat domain-containing protein [Calothrix sp. UHCC 0171]
MSELNQVENLIPNESSTQEIIQTALITEDEDIYWDLVYILQVRGGDEEFTAASNLCANGNTKDRTLGVNIIAQLGTTKGKFRSRDRGDILLELLSHEKDASVLAAIGYAFGHLQDDRGILPLIKFKNHIDCDVRMGVVFGLSCQEDESAIQVLIKLSGDVDADVRNWATFGLGSQIAVDTPEIRDALYERIISEIGDDEDDTIAEIRGEALLGLAIRKDERVIKPLIAELESGCVGKLSVEAALEIGDNRLYSSLVKLEDWWDVDVELLQAAMAKCGT